MNRLTLAAMPLALLAAACGPRAGLVTAPPPPAGSGLDAPAPDVIDKAADAVAVASDKVDRAWAAYQIVRGVAEMVVPFLSPERVALIRSIEAAADDRFARARAATDLARQAIELRQAADAVARLDDLTTDKD